MFYNTTREMTKVLLITVDICPIHSLLRVTFYSEIANVPSLIIASLCSPLVHIQQRRTHKMAVNVCWMLPDAESRRVAPFFVRRRHFREEGRRCFDDDADFSKRLPFTVAPDDWLVKGAAGLVFSSLQFSLVRD